MKKLTYALIISLVLVTAFGIALGIVTNIKQDKVFKETAVYFNDKGRAEMKHSLSNIYPGQSYSYSVNLNANDGDEFNVDVSFVKNGSDSIAKFIDVQLKLNDRLVDTAKLSEYLSGKTVKFLANYDGTDVIKLEVVYSMAISVGDEAQNTTADFTIVLIAKR